MSQKERKGPWGPILSSTVDEEDEEDPIKQLIEQQDQLHDMNCPPDTDVEEWSKIQRKRASDLEKEIWDRIYTKRQKRLFK